MKTIAQEMSDSPREEDISPLPAANPPVVRKEITLREWLFGQVLSALISNPNSTKSWIETHSVESALAITNAAVAALNKNENSHE